MNIEIATPNGVVLNSEIKYFVVSGENGQFAVLKDHIPVVSAVKNGYIKVIDNNGEDNFYIVESAIIEFSKNKSNIMAQVAIAGCSIEEAKSNYEAFVESIRQSNHKSKMDYTKIERDLHKNIKQAKAGKL